MGSIWSQSDFVLLNYYECERRERKTQSAARKRGARVCNSAAPASWSWRRKISCGGKQEDTNWLGGASFNKTKSIRTITRELRAWMKVCTYTLHTRLMQCGVRAITWWIHNTQPHKNIVVVQRVHIFFSFNQNQLNCFSSMQILRCFWWNRTATNYFNLSIIPSLTTCTNSIT